MSNHPEDLGSESLRRRLTHKLKDREEFNLAKSDHEPPSNWFKFMLSCPVRKHMSMIELFTQWSALLLYFPFGVLSICDPKAAGKMFGIESGTYGDGMARISGMQSAVVAFLYVTFSRASPSISSNCIILATAFERIVIVDIFLFLMFWQQLLPIEFLLAIMVMDSGLSISTIVLWFYESEVASVGKFFINISQVMSFNEPTSHHSSKAVQILGLVQMIIGGVMIAFPNLSNQFLYLSAIELDGHSRGLLSICYFTSAVIGYIHFLSGGADSKAFNLASVCYRLVLSIPVVITLGMLSQIPFGLMGYFVCLDGMSSLVFLLSLCIDN